MFDQRRFFHCVSLDSPPGQAGGFAHTLCFQPTFHPESECLERYEALRRQALEPGGGSCPADLEVAFIECQGLADWLAAGPPCPSKVVILSKEQLPKLQEPQSPSGVLVLALVGLVLGNRQEEQDDRANG